VLVADGNVVGPAEVAVAVAGEEAELDPTMLVSLLRVQKLFRLSPDPCELHEYPNGQHPLPQAGRLS